MTTAALYTLYNPIVPPKSNKPVSGKELQEKLENFFILYSPQHIAEGTVDRCREFAKKNGVVALKSHIKKEFNADLDSVDVSELGWQRVYRSLVEFYSHHNQRGKDLHQIYIFAKRHGLWKLDEKLLKIYGQSLTAYRNRNLIKWKRNWKSFLTRHHSERVEYELKRFYIFVARRPEKYDRHNDLDRLVKWACQNTREAVNEKLLEKYNFCLDDVKMVKGATKAERLTNLKSQLVQFYQRYDPNVLGGMKHVSNFEHTTETPEIRALEEEAERGVYHLEELEERLQQKYGASLTDELSNEIRRRLVAFYGEINVEKSLESIDKIVEYAYREGLHAMNGKLSLTYGRGIVIADLM